MNVEVKDVIVTDAPGVEATLDVTIVVTRKNPYVDNCY